jgi:IclR family transcriptional regulator, KDG regulon repressor
VKERRGQKKSETRARSAPARRYRIQALDRAAAILNCFDANDQELNVRDVGERTGLHKSTAHRILMALQHNGFVEQNPVSGRYHLGLQLVKLGEHAIARLDVAVIARPFLADLAERTRRRVHLAVMDGDQVVILDRADGADAASTPSWPGRLFPAHCTAMGKAMLAGMDEQDVRRVVGKRQLKRFTARTITSVDSLVAELRTVARRGYSVADQEMGLGLVTVGAGIRNHIGTVVAALSVSASSTEARGTTLSGLAEEVKRTAAQISARLGYRPSAEAAV